MIHFSLAARYAYLKLKTYWTKWNITMNNKTANQIFFILFSRDSTLAKF